MAACPTCGEKLTYILQYDRLYCYACGNYAPKGYGTSPSVGPTIHLGGDGDSHEGHFHCPSCEKELTFIEQYDRYYCFGCEKYAPKDIAPLTLTPEEEPAAAAASTQAASLVPEAGSVDDAAEDTTEPAHPAGEDEPESAGVAARTPATAGGNPEPDLEPGPEPEEDIDEPAEDRPELRRSEVKGAKKARLIEWCRAYSLDTTGTKVVLRERLIEHMDEHDIDPPEPIMIEAELDEEVAAEVTIPEEEPQVEPALEEMPPDETPPADESVAEEVAPEELDTETAVEEPPEEVAEEELPPAGEESRSETATVDAIPEELPAEPSPEAVPEGEVAVEEPPPAEPQAEPKADATAEATPDLVPSEPASPEPEAVAVPEVAPPVKAAIPPLELTKPAAAAAPTPAFPSTPTPAPAIATPAPAVSTRRALACPTCGKRLTYIAQYDRLFCYACGNYAPRGYGTELVPVQPAVRPTPAVPSVSVEPRVEVPKVVARVANPCPTCGRELTYIKQYHRYYCHSCKKYAPKRARNPCPTCGQELRYIPQYGRYYCYSCGNYAPRTYVPTAATAAVVTRPGAAPAMLAGPIAAQAAATAVVPEAAVVREHRHGRPGAGIALAATGFALLIVQNLLSTILPALGVFDPATLGAQGGQLLLLVGFFGLVLAMAGVVTGLFAVGKR